MSDTATAPADTGHVTAYASVLYDIASTMTAIITLAYDATQSTGQSQASQLVALAALAERVGYMADRAIGFEVKEADQWLLTSGASDSLTALEIGHA